MDPFSTCNSPQNHSCFSAHFQAYDSVCYDSLMQTRNIRQPEWKKFQRGKEAVEEGRASLRSNSCMACLMCQCD